MKPQSQPQDPGARAQNPTMPSARDGRFLEEEIHFSGRYSRSVYESIALSFRPFRVRVSFLLALGFVGRFLLLYGSIVTGYWADSLCRPPAPCHPVPAFLAGFGHAQYLELLIALAAAGFLVNSVFRIAISRTGARAVSLLYDEVTLRTSRLPMSFFDTTPVGRIVSRFSSDYGAAFRMAGGPLGEFLCLVFDLVLMLLLLGSKGPAFAALALILLAANVGIYRLNRDKLRRERRALSQARGPSIAHFAETAQGSKSIRAFHRVETFARRFRALNLGMHSQRLRTVTAAQSFGFQMAACTACMTLLVGALGMRLVQEAWLSLGTLAVVFTFLGLMTATLQQFFEWLSNLEEALTGVERLDHYLRRPLEPGNELPSTSAFRLPGQAIAPAPEFRLPGKRAGLPRDAALPPVRPRGLEVSVRSLCLRYRADQPLVLKDVSFSLRAGASLGIVGHTGSGKSSLIQALFHLYPAESGEILVGGLRARLDALRPLAADERSLAEQRALLTLIPQEPTLFRGTLRDNLTWESRLSDAEILGALKQAGMEDWVTELGTGGLDLPIAEKGLNLSAGERQLVCLARALLEDAPVVVMDEATSSIDPASERTLERTLKKGFAGRTRIIVAHRLSTVENCDYVLWLDAGEVRAFGRPSEVLPRFQAGQR